jgi:hypothetical protein
MLSEVHLCYSVSLVVLNVDIRVYSRIYYKTLKVIQFNLIDLHFDGTI